MKRIILSIIIVLSLVTSSFATWQTDFVDDYTKINIFKAVENALKVGQPPVVIIREGLTLEGLNPQNLIMALYCAGAKGSDIIDGGKVNGVSSLVVTAGYKKSIVECSDDVVDSQAYTPVSTGFSGGRSAGSGGGSIVFASPSTF